MTARTETRPIDWLIAAYVAGLHVALAVVSMTIIKMGNSTAKVVTMIVGGGSNSSGGDTGTQQPGGISGGSGECTNFAPIGSSNVQTLGEFKPNLSQSADQALIVNTGTTPGAYPLNISFVYTDEQNH